MKKLIVMLLIACSVLGCACGEVDVDGLYKNRDVDDRFDASAVEIDLDSAVSGSGFEVSQGTVTITRPGDYLLTGNFEGQVRVDVSQEDHVRLILQNVTIVSPKGPAVFVRQADKLVVTLADGSVNTLTDTEGAVEDGGEVAAALFANDDLSINGTGTLIVNGKANHGIHSKADLVIADGEITVSAANDGIKGKNSVLILDGTITSVSGGDGIVSTRQDKEDKGWIVIAGGTVTVTAEDKGIQAETDITLQGGEVTVHAGDDGLHGRNVSIHEGLVRVQSEDEGIQADELLQITGGEVHVQGAGDLKGSKRQIEDSATIVYTK